MHLGLMLSRLQSKQRMARGCLVSIGGCRSGAVKTWNNMAARIAEYEWNADMLQEVAEEPKKMGPDALLKQKVKQKRFREGYEDGLSSTHKATSALAFVMSETPVEMLGQFSRCATYQVLTLLLDMARG